MPVKNECRCDQPPGGHGLCEAHQLAICRSDGHHCTHECRDRPYFELRQDLEKWVYEQVTKTVVSGQLNRSQLDVLHRGRYVDASNGDVFTFQMPHEEPDGAPAVMVSHGHGH